MRIFLPILLAALFALAVPADAQQGGPGLTAATAQLFDAVRRKDLGAAQAAVAAGADIEAKDSFGLRAVDLAIDLGNFDLAHYLLSVSNLRLQAAQTEPANSTLSAAPAAGTDAALPDPTPSNRALVTPTPQRTTRPATPPVPAARIQLPPAPPVQGPSAFDPQVAPDSFAPPIVGDVLGPGTTDFSPVAPKPPKPAPAPMEKSSAPPRPAASMEPAPSSTPPTQPEKSGLLDRVTGLFRSEPGPTPPAEAAPPMTAPTPTTPGKVTQLQSKPVAVAKPVAPVMPAPVKDAPTPKPMAEPAPPPVPKAQPATEAASASMDDTAETQNPGLFDRFTGLFGSAPSSETEPSPGTSSPADQPRVDPAPPSRFTNPRPILPMARPLAAPTPDKKAEAVPPTPAPPSEEAAAVKAAEAARPGIPTPETATPETTMQKAAAASDTSHDDPGLIDRIATMLRSPSPEEPKTVPATSVEPVEPTMPIAVPAQPMATVSAATEPADFQSVAAAEPPSRPEPAIDAADAARTATQVPEQTAPSLLSRIGNFFGGATTPAKPTADMATPPSTPSETTPAPAMTTAEAEPAPQPAAPAPKVAAGFDAPPKPNEFTPRIVGNSFGQGDPIPPESKAPPEPAPPPEPEPAQAPMPRETEAPPTQDTPNSKPGMFESVTNWFKPSADSTEPSSETPTTASADVAALPPISPPASPTTRLVAIEQLQLGKFMRLGRSRQVEHVPEEECIEKRSWNTWFCVEEIAWPESMVKTFDVGSALYRGPKSIVRYDHDLATHIHVIFPAEDFVKVADYFEKQLGRPSETPNIMTAMIAAPALPNPTLRWIANDQGGRAILEIRQIDDLRWVLPDTQYGVLRLYREGSEPVFTLLSISDLLLTRLRRPGGG